MIVLKEFEFDAAHYLPSYNGKCEHLHGHTYKLVVKVEGRPDMEGMVMDFSLLKKIVQMKVLRKLDHKLLNDVIPNPSAENIAIWVWDQLAKQLYTDNRRLLKWRSGRPVPAAAFTTGSFMKGNFAERKRLWQV